MGGADDHGEEASPSASSHLHRRRSRSRSRDDDDGRRRRGRSRSHDRGGGRKSRRRRRSRSRSAERVCLPGGVEAFYPRHNKITGYTARRLYVFNGLRRSGNHLAIQYVISGLGDGQVVLLNDVVRRVLEKGQGRLKDCLPWAVVQEDQDFGEVVNRKLMTRQALESLLQEGGEMPCLVVSLEEKSVGNSKQILRFFSALLPDPSAPSKLVLVCRDILNTVASRLEFNASVRLNGIIMPVDEETVKFWRSYLEAGAEDPSILVFNYNRFLLDNAYRRELAAAFGLDYASLVDSEVPRFGLGSSFTRSNERQSTEQYLSRWTRFQDNDVIKACLHDPEVRAVLVQHFHGDRLQLPPPSPSTAATTSASKEAKVVSPSQPPQAREIPGEQDTAHQPSTATTTPHAEVPT